jgi:isoamylase
MTTTAKRRVVAGTPYPQGATSDGAGVNFSLFSAHATKVELCLFDESGRHEIERIELPEFTDELWHGYVEDVHPGTVYGYRVHGPYQPEAGHRFNPNKLLLDPFARATVGSLEWNDACFGYIVGAPEGDLSFDTRDSAPFVPRAVVVDPAFYLSGEAARPTVPWDETIVYELHVGGYTKRRSDLPPAQRGTFAGLSNPQVIEHIKSLGVTSVELMPVHLFVNDRHLLDRGLSNYWGYNSIGFFAPDPRYLANRTDGLREFREMVSRFHDAGLEVILDVVYNHTAEGNELGPTLSFKGIDNASYYRLIPDHPRYYNNDAGTGNTLNLRHPRVTQMITDSLRYWAADAHVDGFRFDLGTTLARPEECFDDHSGFLIACIQDPVLAHVKLIAEPWDCGPGGYQMGRFPPGWAEWNDSFRDRVRDFWRGAVSAGVLAPALCASADSFNHRGRKPWASLNFVTAHDGFTMQDVVSYAGKHNDANGENNTDGSNNNRSTSYGVEGPADDPAIVSLRQQHVRNMLATLLCAQGTPMVLGGDEFGRTQDGNNNAYCQDNETSWVDWQLAKEHEELTQFVRRLTALRRDLPHLRPNRFLTGEVVEATGMKDVAWLIADGSEITQPQWEDDQFRCFGMLLGGEPSPCLLVFNGSTEDVAWTLPQLCAERAWFVRIDTSQTSDAQPLAWRDPVYQVKGRSVAILQMRTL